MRVSIEKHSEHRETKLIGGAITFLALKNESSFLLVSDCNGIKLVENNKILFKEVFHILKYAEIKDIIYYEPDNCYLLCVNDHLYIKEINQKKPYIFLKFGIYSSSYRLLHLDEPSGRLIATRRWNWVSVINPLTKKIEIDFKLSQICMHQKIVIEDMALLDRPQNGTQIMVLSKKGVIFMMSFKANRQCRNHVIHLISERKEQGRYLAASPDGQYLCVLLISALRVKTSRILLFQHQASGLVKKVQFDAWNSDFKYLVTLDPAAYHSGRLILLGLTKREKSHFFSFDQTKNTLVEMEDLRKDQLDCYPQRVVKQPNGTSLYYAGNRGLIVRVCLTFVEE